MRCRPSGWIDVVDKQKLWSNGLSWSRFYILPVTRQGFEKSDGSDEVVDPPRDTLLSYEILLLTYRLQPPPPRNYIVHTAVQHQQELTLKRHVLSSRATINGEFLVYIVSEQSAETFVR